MKIETDENVKLREALSLMGSALQLLDAVDAPGEIGGHLDMSICALRRALAEEDSVAISFRWTDRHRTQTAAHYPPLRKTQ